MLMAFQLLGIYHVSSVCPVLKRFVNKGKGWYFFKEKKKKTSECSFTFAVGFLFYFTYLVVLNSIKIKHFKSCVCDQFDDSVKRTIKNVNHSCFTVLSLERHILFSNLQLCAVWKWTILTEIPGKHTESDKIKIFLHESGHISIRNSTLFFSFDHDGRHRALQQKSISSCRISCVWEAIGRKCSTFKCIWGSMLSAIDLLTLPPLKASLGRLMSSCCGLYCMVSLTQWTIWWTETPEGAVSY